MPRPHTLWTTALALSAAASAWHQNREADVFFHLELGRAVIAHGARTVPEPYALAEFAPTCLVPAWLWDVIAYGLHGLGGFVALSLFTIASAVVAAALLARWLPAAMSGGGFLPYAVVTACTLACLAPRFQMRPQTAAIAVLAGFLALCYAHVARAGRARGLSGACLVGLALLWAQLHGSFVLAPVAFAIVAVGRRLETRSFERAAVRTDLLVLAGSTAALAASAAGLDVFAYIGSHGYGDAVRFIHEMRPPTWVELIDLQGPSGKALALLWLLSLFGLTRDGRWQWTAIALALVGHLLLSRAFRFAAENALLGAPLALAGAENVATWARRAIADRLRPPMAAGLVVASAGLLLVSSLENRGGYGARFQLGLDEMAFPRLAATYLARLPAGTPVLSSFLAGPPLGFWSQGRLRTYVDGRTPMYFDDADYALQREVFTNDQALGFALTRYGFRAAVVARAHGVCDMLAKRWRPVVIEAGYTTFVPAGEEPPLTGVDPCGPVFVHGEADPAAVDRARVRLATLGASPFLDFLAAERLLLEPTADGARAQALLERSAAPIYALSHRRARIAASLASGDVETAYRSITEALRERDASVLRFVVRPELALNAERARALLELGLSVVGEAASPSLRSLMAAVCTEQGDAECARFHALRAAARAAPNVEPTLRWLVQHADTPRKRADAKAWLELLHSERREAAAAVP